MALQPPPVQGPVQAGNVYYRDFFADAANDPFNGEYTNALIPYAVPAYMAVPPAEVAALAISCRSQRVPTAFLLLHNDDKLLHIYIQLEKFEPRFGFPASPLDNRLFIGKGELHHNNHQLVEWDAQYFHRTANICIPFADIIDTAVAANADPNLLVGPYTAEDANTETIRVRNTCYVPPAYVPLFLAGPLSPRQAWETVRAQIMVDQREESCAPLINFLRCAITISQAGQAPVLCTAPPTAPLAPPLLLDRRRLIIEQDFPVLNNNLMHLQQTQIAGQLGLLVNETRATREAEAERKAAEKNKTPDQYLGPAGIIRLQRYCQVAITADLPDFWTQISKSPKAQHLSILQWEINRVKLELNEPDLPFVASAGLWEAIRSLQWEMTTNDAVNTGINPFLLGDHDITDALNKQAVYEMMHGDGASPSLDEAAALVKAKAGAPKLIFNARQQLKRFEIVNNIILGPRHTFCAALNVLGNRMIASEHMLHQLHLQHLLLPTLLCKKIAVQSSNWYRNQSCSPAPIPAPHFIQIFTDIEEDRHWLPSTPPAFLRLLGLSYFESPAPAPTPAFVPVPVRPSPAPRGQPPTRPPANPSAPAPAPSPAVQERANNLAFNATLFQSYKDSPMQCRILRGKIRNNELPVLPPSKVDGEQMCLAFHTKGTCNPNCGRIADHIEYSAEEYAPLLEWCTTHFPTE
jgi:hypothetical protein